MAFAARYNGTCLKCSKPVVKGQYIRWSRNRDEKGKVYHENCDAPDSVPQSVSSPDEAQAQINQIEEQIADVQTPPSAPVSEPPSDGLMGEFAKALMPYIKSKLDTKLDEKGVRAVVDKYIAENPLATPFKVEVSAPNSEPVTIENAHESLPKLLYLVSKRHHTLLFDGPNGGPGSGKTTMSFQVAEALKLKCGYISLNPQTTASRLDGFIDATGVFRDTVFYQCYTEGGVFVLEEIDHAGGTILTSMNAAIENGHAAFPNGMKPRHPDFVLIATANTNGLGANLNHPERKPLDAATRDRFTFLPINYDERLERTIALSINPKAAKWVNWVQQTRAFAKSHKIRLIATPRATFRAAEYSKDDTFTTSEIADLVIFKGMDTAIRTQVLAGVPLP